MAQRNATNGARAQSLAGLAEDQQVHPFDHDLRAEVRRELAGFLQTKRAEAAQIDSQFVAAVDSLSDFFLGPGKRLRPTFAWWGWRGRWQASPGGDSCSTGSCGC